MSTATFDRIIEINDRFHDSALLHFAVKVGLFDALGSPETALSVAQRFGWRPEKARITLDALVALDLLSKDGARYRTTREATDLLSSGSDRSLAPVIEHQRLQWDVWAHIDEILVSDKPHRAQQNVRLAKDGAANATYNAAMRNLSIGNIRAFLKMGIARDGDRVLDLAGGHGFYLVEILRRFPAAHGEVWELPQAAAFARQALDEPDIANRAAVREADISITTVPPASADLILLNNCLHYFGPETAGRIVRDCAEALRPGGRVVITAVHLDDCGTAPEPAAKFAFHMLMNATEGGLHRTRALRGYLEAAGIEPETRPGGSLGIMNVNVLWGTKA